MVGAVDLSGVPLVAAFIAGAGLGVLAVLRVVRHLVTMFDQKPVEGRRNRVKRPDLPEPPDDG